MAFTLYYRQSLLWLTALVLFSANTSCAFRENNENAAAYPEHSSVDPRSLPADLDLKVMCVGDSITVGVGDGNENLKDLNNGYRLDLYNLFKANGHDPQFIGSQKSGTDNPQPQMEAIGGLVINAILDNVKKSGSLIRDANLVLIHAGTNDNVVQNASDPSASFANAPNRLGELIDYVVCNDPAAVVLVAKLIQNKFNQEQTNAFNSAVPDIVGDRYMKGFKVRVVDMSMIGGNELSDLLHPTAAGYADMAQRWYTAIQGIPSDWWSTSGTNGASSGSPLQQCARGSNYFTPAINGNIVATGAHVESDPGEPASADGNTFTPNWNDKGIVALGTGNPGSGVTFADIDGDGHNDYIWTNYTKGEEGSIHVWLAGSNNAWTPVNNGEKIAWGLPGTSYVELADLDGDKKAEYIVIADGQWHIWQNGGPNGQDWLWNALPNAAAQLNYIFVDAAPFHYFADMDGDGKADLIIYNTNGVLDLYLNNGPDGDGGFRWTQCKAVGIATGKPIFMDIDGDGKADYVTVDDDGGLSGWLNKHTAGCSLDWATINDRTPKSLALGTGAPPDQVRLADLTGDKKADYLVVSPDIGTVHLYENDGNTHAPDSTPLGGYGAAVRLNDINGDGVDDYLSVTDQTGLLAYLNAGQFGSDSWVFNRQNNGTVIALGFAGATRHEIHLADMNGDGLDDYLEVDDATGAIHCYLNLGALPNGGWNWDTSPGLIALGVGGDGAGVRLADFDGDGRADYISLDKDGSAKVWLNVGPGLSNWQLVNNGEVAALGVGANRDDVQFADIDGDGLADYVWVHPDTGAAEVWYNTYSNGIVGWSNGGTIVTGQGYKGQNIRFGRIGTSGRADYVAITESDGSLKAWLNQCSNVIASVNRQLNGVCGKAPLPTKTAPEPPPPTPTPVTTNNGQTVIQDTNGVQLTIPTGLTTPTTLTESNGQLFTFFPGGNTVTITTTDDFGHTVVQDPEGDRTTLPFGITAPTTITQSDGEVVTFSPSSGAAASSSTTPPPLLVIPIFSDVPSPTSTPGGVVIPCTLWFFFLCIRFGNVNIGGWELSLPPGPPPRTIGPGPPSFTFPSGFTVNTIGPLPTWPTITFGSDDLPTYTPTSGPSDCKTGTGQICVTSTSFEVSASSTTATSVLSTCATVYGCEASDSATTVTTTSLTSGQSSCPYITPYTPWWTAASQTAPILGAGGPGGTVVYGSFQPPPTADPLITRLSTIFVTQTTTFTTILASTSSLGYLGILAGYVDFGGAGPTFSNYPMVYISGDGSDGFCTQPVGTASPTPATWSDIPVYATWPRITIQAPTPLSSCIYTNPAAPNNGDGGTVSCASSVIPCAVSFGDLGYCGASGVDTAVNPVSDTTLRPLLRCPISSVTSITSTGVSTTVSSSVSTIVG